MVGQFVRLTGRKPGDPALAGIVAVTSFPAYEVPGDTAKVRVRVDNPANETVSVRVGDKSAEATGDSKRAAEQSAAEALLTELARV